jgi:hypothetical protein
LILQFDVSSSEARVIFESEDLVIRDDIKQKGHPIGWPFL